LRSFAYGTSGLRYDSDADRIYWSENFPDERWSLQSGSAVRYLDADGKTHTVRKDQLLYNPSSSSGKTAVVRYHTDGHSSLEILDGADGKTLKSIAAPDSLQLVETAWLGEHGYKLGTSVDAPWVYGEQLTLWFESELETGVEDIFGGNCGDILGGCKQSAKKIIIDGQMYILRHDGLYNITGARVK
jgi:hypothetical protein